MDANMNRDIKFRAWKKDAEEMYQDIAYVKQTWKGSPWIPMQYTGLKDKNGKEIYEGDILEDICTDDGTKLHYIAEIGKGKDNRYGFKLRYIDNGDSCVALLVELASLEIIGNIYENKNLII